MNNTLGKFEKIDTKIIRWRVNYKDGSFLWESDPKTRKESTYKDIDHTNLKSIDLLIPITTMEDVIATETDVQVKTLDNKPAIATLKVYNREVQPYYHMEMPPNSKLILVRREQRSTGRKMALFQVKKQQIRIPFPIPSLGKILIIGWEQKIADQTYKSINYIFPDGHIEHDFRWRNTEAEHNQVDMPETTFTTPELTEISNLRVDVELKEPSAKSDTSVDANIIKSQSTTKVGEKSEPRPGIPDDIMQ